MNDLVVMELKCRGFSGKIKIKNNIVIDAGKLIDFMKGWNIETVKKYCAKNKWECGEVISRCG